MYKILILLALTFGFSLRLQAKLMTYTFEKKEYEVYVLKNANSKQSVFIVHDWDGLMIMR